MKKSMIKIEKVQKQKGETDCGLFAIAHLVEVLYDGDPSTVIFEQGCVMRKHYYDCLVKQNWLPFPKVKAAVTCEHGHSRRQHYYDSSVQLYRVPFPRLKV